MSSPPLGPIKGPPTSPRPDDSKRRSTRLLSPDRALESVDLSTDVDPTSFIRASKRTSSSSNDLLYERDRFRARLQNLNTSHEASSEVETDSRVPSSTNILNMSDAASCDVCDEIGLKTTKLNFRSREDIPLVLHDKLDDLPDSFITSPKLKESFGLVIKSLSLAQLQLVFAWYFNQPLPPTKKMFPWLHGLNKDNFAQKQFFLYQQQQLLMSQQSLDLLYFNLEKPENIRFLMCINAEEYNHESQNSVVFNNNLKNNNALFLDTKEKLPPILKNTLKLNEILRQIDVSRFEIALIISDIFKKAFDKEIPDDLMEVFKQDCIRINHLPIFLDLDPDRGVSLRNFHIQVAKLATCSDFLVYGPSSPTMESCARVLWLAQRYELALNKRSSHYNVFISNDSLDTLVNDSTNQPTSLSRTESKLVFDIHEHETSSLESGVSHILPTSDILWNNDYQIKEKIETTRMSSATSITRNVWIGNYWDYQIMMTYLMEHNTSYLKHYSTQHLSFNSLKLRNLYCEPKNSIVTNLLKKSENGSLLDYLSLPKANWRLFVFCHSGGSFPDLMTLSTLLFKYSLSSHRIEEDSDDDPDFTVLEFPPSGSIGIGDCSKDNLISIVNTCKLIYLYSSSTSEDSDVLSTLIYCSDGYTELSLLVLCYVMYSQNVSLQDAMLKLHLDYGRPFYIFNSDVTILKKLSILLRKFSPANPENKNKIEWLSLESLTNIEINEILLSNPGVKPNKNVRLGYIANDDDDSSSSSDESDSDLEFAPLIDWVSEVEGSIPSRILPYLYLGSLKHANSLPLLNKVGIKKIISVGEQLDWLNGYKFRANHDIEVQEINDGNIQLYTIKPKKDLGANHPHKCSIESVMKVNNLQDDGIDELTRSLPNMLQYIDDEYVKTDGNTKILIHCRVGVSRSATVVISETMRRLGLSLPDAYLYVRVRRLNIIIQPNLRFMYELFKWEEAQKEKRDHQQGHLREIDWFMMCREIMKLNIPYLNN
ncbi:uncharacterized protein CANTADRAFT_4115 [Suhomyces tanzawaensis NRRL Y-17324]|uniref:Uncharacterized protein n=1 Tax=Suhomyces tanzawaensis NRRL Y-17324 TaxID=984487 RepID=A0A1E4SRF3_9ASCO|nr:uncharacterized protein CANTADRAFT_4115 [Suhomyces tanzawaensis NRRL Y-17324]ODV82075.1 hypothetical protein CANTADRAFT_4115 [Suhomyces tanzawaensis NRRL Y-17324]